MIRTARFIVLFLAFLFLLAAPSPGLAKVREYHLTIAKGKVNLTGTPAEAMTVNNGIPGPTLRFIEGDTARIQVTNQMDVDTSVHWHGLLVPPGMDGVPDISFPPIAPKTTFTYEFPIRQSGTYWYHSHTRLQEQSGVYGSIVIEPKDYQSPADRELVLVLSDWTDDRPGYVMQALKRGSEFFSVQKGSAQSIAGAIKLGHLGDYTMRELVRMPPMDISDVAYDRFLINGKPMQKLAARPGESFRLRVINGSASSFFYLEFAGGPLTIFSADGQDVEPIKVKRLLMGVAETYDLLIKLPGKGSYELRATAQDGSSWAALWLGSGHPHPAPAIPRPDLYLLHGTPSLGRILALTPAGSMGMPDSAVEAGKFDKPGMAGMGGMKMGHNAMKGMDMAKAQHGEMKMPSSEQGHAPKMAPMAKAPAAPPSGKRWAHDFAPLASDVAASPALARDGGPERPWPPYAKLKAKHSTALSKKRPVRNIRLTLDGDMRRYVWLLNNKPLSESDNIRIKKGEAVRFIMINRTMMHHPMHLHGHFFRVINGQGDYSPLKHTVDVAPMSTTVIEFAADEKGDWFFHCHLLYHMKAGMARLVHYQGFVPPAAVRAVRPRLYQEPWYPMVDASLLSNMSEGAAKLASTRNVIGVEWEIGWQRRTKAAWEVMPTWAYHVNRFFSAFAGGHLEGEAGVLDKTRGILGINYLLPYNLHSMLWVDTDLGGRVKLARAWDLTPRLALFGSWQYDTHDFWEAEAGLSYMINSHLSLVGQWHSEYGWGAGLGFSF
ncbi:MAG: multicopper oxidase domain-containing protein [Desulfarculaceae bacterium]|nr:multicopper oxidase domain-containing protein [Desulfarculaceae bacterium]MCF8072356.1 multicopper oxidase domain-containing protein [Desulfarculaceae bacterium]MCF8100277.1 multicopper oxidase domain-containing protein [Desulfarculaceae bacterium]MCF8116150.1 multicopper oxidase domain-containing protein [Desulfarculaceae bacterium]